MPHYGRKNEVYLIIGIRIFVRGFVVVVRVRVRDFVVVVRVRVRGFVVVVRVRPRVRDRDPNP